MAEFADAVIMKHKYTVKYALKTNSIWKCKSTIRLFIIVSHKSKLNNFITWKYALKVILFKNQRIKGYSKSVIE